MYGRIEGKTTSVNWWDPTNPDSQLMYTSLAHQRERLEQQNAQLKEDSQRARDQAAVGNKVLQGQLESLENFRLNKEKIEEEMQRKDKLIEQRKQEHEEALYRLEKKAILDKDRLGAHMVFVLSTLPVFPPSQERKGGGGEDIQLFHDIKVK